MPIRVAVIDGHTMTRYGLAQVIADHADIEVVGEAGSAADGLRMVATLEPDVVTVDIALPDRDGLRLARELRDRYGELGIVVLTSQREDDVLFRALETGVSAFVAKAAPVDEIVAAIRHAAVAASSFTATGLAEAMMRRHLAADQPTLSPRESQVLQMLAAGMSTPDIARALFVSPSTAKTYVGRIYEKLGASNRAQAVMTALRAGLLHTELPRPA